MSIRGAKTILVANALSKKIDIENGTYGGDGLSNAHEGVLCMVSFPSPAWLTDLKVSYASDQ